MSRQSHALTVKATGLARVLVTTITITQPDVFDAQFDTRAIWDTGASGTVITQKIVDALQLIPTGFTKVNTASQQNIDTPTYVVDVVLQNGVRVMSVNVSLGVILDGIDVLIGMDIIGLGDFSVTNFNGNTCMSFRVPSLHQIDYVEEAEILARTPIIASPKIGRNDRCHCGSGKKFKHCHGTKM